MEYKPKTIFWLAGENSGDLHASLVMHRLNGDIPYLNHIGIGGNRMQKEGLQPLFAFGRFAVMGFAEVIKHLRFFMKVEAAIKKVFQTAKPDLVILVDYPGLNMRVAKFAEAAKIPVLYFICPQFWAWKHNRVYDLKANTHHVACILPFEADMLSIHNIRNTYVGHPIAEEVSYELDRDAFARFYGLDPAKQWIGFFPGSRNDEVERLLPVYLQTLSMLDQDKYQFLFSKARSVSHPLFTFILDQHPAIRPYIIDGYNYEMMKYSEFLVIKSGTTTLEAAYIGTPSVIVYKTGKISYQIGKRFIRVDKIGLPNIILEQKVLPELIQDEVTPRNISQTILSCLGDAQVMSKMKQELTHIHKLLGNKTASKEMVKIISEMLGL